MRDEDMHNILSRYFSAGDAPFFFHEQIQSFSWFPAIWNDLYGLGNSTVFRLWYDYPIQIIIKILFTLGFSWWMIDKFFWLGTAVLSCLSMYILSKHIFKSRTSRLLSVLIYSSNTYALMLFGGGQLGVYIGYSLLPLFLSMWISVYSRIVLGEYLISKNHWKKNMSLLFFTGLISSALLAVDLRIGFIGCLLVSCYFLWELLFNRKSSFNKHIYIRNITIAIVVVSIIVFFIHMYWLLPAMLFRGVISGVGDDISGVGIVSYLSFADFSHTLSLLHPNWPENLFGFVHFMRPEFLLLPIVAFMSLIFVKDKRALFFVGISFIGAFLAKGSNEPFGNIYEWLFIHVPGFVMFRDPTKFYCLIALSYAILIPIVIVSIGERIQFKPITYKRYIRMILLCLVCLIWIILHKEFYEGSLRGNFSPPILPHDYVVYKDILINDPNFGRVLWVPQQDRFAFTNNTHPFVDANTIIKESSSSSFIQIATSSAFIFNARQMGIKYIAIATDEAKKMYINNNVFDPVMRENYIKAFQSINLPLVSKFDSLFLFDLERNNPLIFDSNGDAYSYIANSSTNYNIHIPSGHKDAYVNFLMTYDPHWRLVIGNTFVSPNKRNDGFMSFTLPNKEQGVINLVYLPQQYAVVGAVISGLSIVCVIVCTILLKMKHKPL